MWKYQTRIKILGLLPLILCGCSDLKQSIGIEKVAPDEFTVNPYEQQLEVPPDFGELPKDGRKQQQKTHPRSNKTATPSKAEEKILNKMSGKKNN
jgi:hypothetical protein